MAIINSIISGGGGSGTQINDFRGKNIQFITTLYSLDVKVGDTTYPSWTPSTTATTIRTADANFTYSGIDLSQHDYIIRQTFVVPHNYSTLSNGRCQTWTRQRYYAISYHLVENGTTTISTFGTFKKATILTLLNLGWATGITDTGGRYYKNNYGIYFNNPTIPSITNSVTPTITLSCPSLMAICSSTYHTTTSANNLNQDTTIGHVRYELYSADVGSTTESTLYDSASKFYLNGWNAYQI